MKGKRNKLYDSQQLEEIDDQIILEANNEEDYDKIVRKIEEINKYTEQLEESDTVFLKWLISPQKELPEDLKEVMQNIQTKLNISFMREQMADVARLIKLEKYRNRLEDRIFSMDDSQLLNQDPETIVKLYSMISKTTEKSLENLRKFIVSTGGQEALNNNSTQISSKEKIVDEMFNLNEKAISNLVKLSSLSEEQLEKLDEIFPELRDNETLKSEEDKLE